ncbi:ribosome hibernation promotion factor [Catelliglobosispora koreensis]|uniref:ribosome hibernation promotion factor n=1 Tax=Catelliglobosispora koreensis TaxID=129052 RepID=UPI0003608E17|nr:HPF/RaiA family ribosome-associated protein [Catelliglobosispora koreensis]
MTTQQLQIEISAHGAIPARAKEYARHKLEALMRLAPQPVLAARVRLIRTTHRSTGEHVIVEAVMDVNGRQIRAQVAAQGSQEAIDLVQDRLRRKLSQLGRHPSWHGARERAHRPGYAVRPPAEREVLQHKTYGPTYGTAQEAAFDMELMDYDFQLFTDVDSGDDSLVYRTGSEAFGVARAAQQPVLPLRAAIGTLDATDLPYLFYVDADSKRGNVLYRRHDGNYGLIKPA